MRAADGTGPGTAGGPREEGKQGLALGLQQPREGRVEGAPPLGSVQGSLLLGRLLRKT